MTPNSLPPNWRRPLAKVLGIAFCFAVTICVVIVGMAIWGAFLAPQPDLVSRANEINNHRGPSVFVPPDIPAAYDAKVDDAERDRARIKAERDAEAEESVEVEREEKREERLRAATTILRPNMDVIGSAEVIEGRRFAFLMLHPSGNRYSQCVEDGVAGPQYFGADRFLWETAKASDLADTWARRERPGTYRVKSAEKETFSMTAILVDVPTARRYKLEMNGFDKVGDVVLDLTPLDW